MGRWCSMRSSATSRQACTASIVGTGICRGSVSWSSGTLISRSASLTQASSRAPKAMAGWSSPWTGGISPSSRGRALSRSCRSDQGASSRHAHRHALPPAPARRAGACGGRAGQGRRRRAPGRRRRRPRVQQAGRGERQRPGGRLGHRRGPPSRCRHAEPGGPRGVARPARRRAGRRRGRDRARLLPRRRAHGRPRDRGRLPRLLRRHRDLQERARAAPGVRGGAPGADGAGDRQPVPVAASLPRPPEPSRAGGGHRRDRRRRARPSGRGDRPRHHRDRDPRLRARRARPRRCGLTPVAGGARGTPPGGPGRELLTPGRVRALLAAHGLRASKALGQHYLVDPNTARKGVRLAQVAAGDTVLEIGPGLGSLTLALREAGARVAAVEADARLLPALAEVLGEDPDVRVVTADAVRADLAALAPDARGVVANLPYNIAATVVLRVLIDYRQYQRLTVTVQREVGERLAAAAGTAAYGATSAKVAALADARV